MANNTTVHDERLPAFLETFPAPLHHKQPESYGDLWVFWTQDEENNSSSADFVTRMIYDKIKSVISIKVKDAFLGVILQFWAPVIMGGRQLLSTSGQPFAVSDLDNGLKRYRLCSLEYQYDIEEGNNQDGMIKSGAPASAFLNRLPEIVDVYDH